MAFLQITFPLSGVETSILIPPLVAFGISAPYITGFQGLDDQAERIRSLGAPAPGSFEAFGELSSLQAALDRFKEAFDILCQYNLDQGYGMKFALEAKPTLKVSQAP